MTTCNPSRKACSTCKLELPVSEFHQVGGDAERTRARCRSCSWIAEKNRRKRRVSGDKSDRRGKIFVTAENTKLCSSCKKMLPVECFGRNPRTASRLETRCRPCNVQRTNAKKTTDLKFYLRVAAASHKRGFSSPRKRRLAMIADSCICTEVLYDLWVKQDGKCAVTGLPMTHISGQGRVGTNLSIDRIDSTAGYTRDNIRLVCSQVNLMRSSLSDSELVDWCHKVIQGQSVHTFHI
jgi:hypothetical protein